MGPVKLAEWDQAPQKPATTPVQVWLTAAAPPTTASSSMSFTLLLRLLLLLSMSPASWLQAACCLCSMTSWPQAPVAQEMNQRQQQPASRNQHSNSAGGHDVGLHQHRKPKQMTGIHLQSWLCSTQHTTHHTHVPEMSWPFSCRTVQCTPYCPRTTPWKAATCPSTGASKGGPSGL